MLRGNWYKEYMSHIKNIEIKNFKSIRHQKIEDCRRVNVFIGYPNVGKSNILEALGTFSVQALKIQHFNFNEICRVKSFSELYFNRDTRESARVVIDNKFESELIIDESNQLQVRINQFSGSVSNTVFSVSVNNHNFNFQTLENKANSLDLNIKKYEFNKREQLNRDRPKALSIPYGNNLWTVLYSNGDLRKEIVEIFRGYSLRVVFETDDQFTLKFQKQLSDESAVSIGYHQIADTLQRLIFYKAAIASNSKSVLLFEEPEAHMFPPYIRKLTADIIFDKSDNQYFIATHSPYVLDELVEEIQDELSVYLVDYNAGETKIIYLSREDLREIRDYGVDLFFNIESYLKNGQVHNA